jgi:hypothetical protein
LGVGGSAVINMKAPMSENFYFPERVG